MRHAPVHALPRGFLDFEIEIAAGAGRDYPVSARSECGEAQATMRFPFDKLVLEKHLLALENALLRSGGVRRRVMAPAEQAVQEFGQAIFDALIDGEVRTCYDLAQREAAQKGLGLRLKLRIEAPELAALPWEFLYDSRQADYVGLSSSTPIVRYLHAAQHVEPLAVELPLRILGLVVSPIGLDALNVENEKQRLETALRELRAAGVVDLQWLPGQTWRDVQRAMRQGPWHILHFVGHGGFDPAMEEGVIALADEDGRAHLLPATLLGRLLDDHNPLRLALLNSCEGARGSDHDIFSSTAATLLRRGVPAVVAMQYEITDEAAIEFSRSFYEAIADGLPIDAAVAEARTAISIAINQTVEWGTPVLYMRSPDGRIFDVPAAPRAAARPVQARPAALPVPVAAGAAPVDAQPAAAETGPPQRRWLAPVALPAMLRDRYLALAIVSLTLLGIWFGAQSAAGWFGASVVEPQPTPGARLIAATAVTQGETAAAVTAAPEATAAPTTAPSPPAFVNLGERGRWGKGTVNHIAYTGAGDLLAVASALGVYLYDRGSLNETRFLQTRSPARQVAFSPDGALLAAGLNDSTVRIWTVADGKLLWTLRSHTRGVQSVAFSADGTLLASGSDDNTVGLWQVAEARLLRRLEGHLSGVTGVAFAPDGRTLASSSRDYTARLWGVADGAKLHVLEGHSSGVLSVAFAPDGETLLTGSWDNSMRLWSVADGTFLRSFDGHTAAVQSASFSPDGQLLASGSWDGSVGLWSVADATLLGTLQGHRSAVLGVSFDAQAETLISGGWDGVVRLWRVEDAALLQTLAGHTASVLGAAVAPDGQLVAAAAADNMIYLRRIADGATERTLEGHNGAVRAVAFSPDGRTLASGGDDATVRLWRTADGALLRTISAAGRGIRSVAFSPGGGYVAAGGDDNTVHIWNIADGAPIATFTGHTNSISSVAFISDGLIASGSADGTVRLWWIPGGKVFHTLDGHTSEVRGIAVSPDGARIASAADDGLVRVWRVEDGALEQALEGHFAGVASLAWTPDGQTLASGSSDNTIRLWRLADGTTAQTLRGHLDLVTSLGFTDRGNALVSASNDGTVRAWGRTD